jgi:hypothetical protein
MFLAKYSGVDGRNLWSRALLCNQGGAPRSIRFDNVNNPVVCGYFYGTCNFGAQTWTSAGSWDVFVAKYSSNSPGTPIWAERFGGTSTDDSYGIAVDGSNYPVITGYFSGSANFGGSTLTSAGGVDIFLLRLDP